MSETIHCSLQMVISECSERWRLIKEKKKKKKLNPLVPFSVITV